MGEVEAARLGLDFVQVVLELMAGGVQLVEEMDGIDALETVQYHSDNELREVRQHTELSSQLCICRPPPPPPRHSASKMPLWTGSGGSGIAS